MHPNTPGGGTALQPSMHSTDAQHANLHAARELLRAPWFPRMWTHRAPRSVAPQYALEQALARGYS
jgi:hypothetical protein